MYLLLTSKTITVSLSISRDEEQKDKKVTTQVVFENAIVVLREDLAPPIVDHDIIGASHFETVNFKS